MRLHLQPSVRCVVCLVLKNTLSQLRAGPLRRGSVLLSRSRRFMIGAALAIEGVDHVHGAHGRAASVLGVDHGVADHVLEEHLEDRARLVVDEAGDALHTVTVSETADRRPVEALDVVHHGAP